MRDAIAASSFAGAVITWETVSRSVTARTSSTVAPRGLFKLNGELAAGVPVVGFPEECNHKVPPKLLRFRLFATVLHDTYRNDTCADMGAALTKHLRAESAPSSELQAFEKTSSSSRKSSMKNRKFHIRPTERLSTLCRRPMVTFLLSVRRTPSFPGVLQKRPGFMSDFQDRTLCIAR